MTLYAVGDIQGCGAEFDALLDRIGFDPARDRLWLAGDLVNRGPRSLEVLRRVKALGDSTTSVLGNHDLHLLAVAAGKREVSEKDTFANVVEAPDAGELVDWLRRRPLLYHDPARNCVLVHAGIPPTWTLKQARRRAGRVEQALRSDDWRADLGTLYGDSPSAWSFHASRTQKHRYTINALTRMRFCNKTTGALDFEHSGPPGSQPDELTPWFDMPARRARDVRIVFGHWSALGLYRRDDVLALDTGCVWGRALTAVPIDPPGQPTAVECGPGAK